MLSQEQMIIAQLADMWQEDLINEYIRLRKDDSEEIMYLRRVVKFWREKYESKVLKDDRIIRPEDYWLVEKGWQLFLIEDF